MRLWSPDDDVPAPWIIDDLREPPACDGRAPDGARLPMPEDALEGEIEPPPPPPPPRVVIIEI